MKRIAAFAVAAVLAGGALSGCSQAASNSSTSTASSSNSSSVSSASASSASASSSSSAASSAGSSSSQTDAVGAEDVVTISLDRSAGTGFEWAYSVSPESAVAFVGSNAESLSSGAVSGGPERDSFTFRANAPGEVAITFDLVRPWEPEAGPAETQVYAFTISSDLKMTLNPYKSQFENEPEWGSNS